MKVHSIRSALLALLLCAPVTAASVEIKWGDTVSALAKRHGTTVQAILNANPGLVPERLPAGRAITVPTAARAVVRPAGIRVSAVLPVQGRVTTAPNAAHVGLDLAARSGTVIRAAMSGTVRTSTFDARSGWGWTVVIDHGNGYTTRYSHNRMNLVRSGERVHTGQPIAQVGSTGNSTGPHLDFRVYQAGALVNPYLLFD
ncbi:M23 family metallopeptidase [Deinococcus kurensis]|uniref:M23 family metallopeptidase n=1 Tax=Deinococcus kurensis TaxID=2662757 RepID=UPI0012D2CCF3|nr:peptidoglycan DD-metalloendopeptidase family protein [Deinococcus kurensis]